MWNLKTKWYKWTYIQNRNRPTDIENKLTAAAAARPLQSCPTLCDPIDASPPGSHPWILQAWMLEWVAISFSSACKWKVKLKSLSSVRLLVTPRTVAYQAPLSMGFFRQEYWNGLPCLFRFIMTKELNFQYFIII